MDKRLLNNILTMLSKDDFQFKYYYAGIGSRETPISILQEMVRIGSHLANLGFILRSGGADGADIAFEHGCRRVGGQAEIWLPWKTFNHHKGPFHLPTHNHFISGYRHHPAFGYLKKSHQALHARNTGQILGKYLDTPVKFVICYTSDGCESHADRTSKTGGTGTAISVASNYSIPIFNLRNENALERLKTCLQEILND